MSYDKTKHHEIRVTVSKESDGSAHAGLEMPQDGLHLGQTVSYSSDNPFSLEFPDASLFGVGGSKVISDGQVLTLVKEGIYECRCSVMPADGPPIQWSPSNPRSGGAHDVQR